MPIKFPFWDLTRSTISSSSDGWNVCGTTQDFNVHSSDPFNITINSTEHDRLESFRYTCRKSRLGRYPRAAKTCQCNGLNGSGTSTVEIDRLEWQYPLGMFTVFASFSLPPILDLSGPVSSCRTEQDPDEPMRLFRLPESEIPMHRQRDCSFRLSLSWEGTSHCPSVQPFPLRRSLFLPFHNNVQNRIS